jgi:hypothetical protein
MLEETGILRGVPRRQPDIVLTGEQQHRLPELGDGLQGGDRVERTFGVVERHCRAVALAVLLGLVRLRVNVLIDASDDWCERMVVRLLLGGDHVVLADVRSS